MERFLPLIVLALIILPLTRCGNGTTDEGDTARGKPAKIRTLTASWFYDIPATFRLWESIYPGLYDTKVAETTALTVSFDRHIDGSTRCYIVDAVVNGLVSPPTQPVCVDLTK